MVFLFKFLIFSVEISPLIVFRMIGLYTSRCTIKTSSMKDTPMTSTNIKTLDLDGESIRPDELSMPVLAREISLQNSAIS